MGSVKTAYPNVVKYSQQPATKMNAAVAKKESPQS